MANTNQNQKLLMDSTCYASKLEKHLEICNAREVDQPPYIVKSINAPLPADLSCPRIPLSGIPKETILDVIDKINTLFDKYLKDHIETLEEHPIHEMVLEEFSEPDRTETSRRHLRQASSLLWLIEKEKLVNNNTCYVELGAGKGQLSFYAFCAWCKPNTNSQVVLVDRASLRHKRDNKLRERAAVRIRADLAHLALERVPAVTERTTVVGFAKHLCGVATDYALRCITSNGVLDKTKGIILATCCHHRCERTLYIANKQIQELGITGDELNIILGIVSWATCGDGRSRERRNRLASNGKDDNVSKEPNRLAHSDDPNGLKFFKQDGVVIENVDKVNTTLDKDLANSNEPNGNLTIELGSKGVYPLSHEYREVIGRRAKAILDFGRVLYLREKGFEARLCYYVPTKVSLENVCIVAKGTNGR